MNVQNSIKKSLFTQYDLEVYFRERELKLISFIPQHHKSMLTLLETAK